MPKPLPLFFRPHARHMASAAALSVVFAAGCASVGAPEQSRTLTGFEQFAVQPDGTRTWRSPETGRYEAVHIDPAAITFSADVQIDNAQREAVRTALSTALTERFAAAGLPAAAAANSRGAVTVRSTVTAVELANPALNAVTTLLLFAPLSRGGLTVEIEALDATTGQRMAAMAFAGKAGVENIGSAYSAAGHAKLQAGVVAERFVALLAGPQTAAAQTR